MITTMMWTPHTFKIVAHREMYGTVETHTEQGCSFTNEVNEITSRTMQLCKSVHNPWKDFLVGRVGLFSRENSHNHRGNDCCGALPLLGEHFPACSNRRKHTATRRLVPKFELEIIAQTPERTLRARPTSKGLAELSLAHATNTQISIATLQEARLAH